MSSSQESKGSGLPSAGETFHNYAADLAAAQPTFEPLGLDEAADVQQAVYASSQREYEKLRHPERVDLSKPDSLQTQPEFKSIFGRWGIPDEMATNLYDAWNSLSAPDAALGAYEKEYVADLTDEQIRESIDYKSWVINREIEGFQTYIKKFGVKEAVELHQTFGIAHFANYDPEVMHQQLERWRDPESAPPQHCRRSVLRLRELL